MAYMVFSQERAVQEDSRGDSHSREPPESRVTSIVGVYLLSWLCVAVSPPPPFLDGEKDLR